MRARAPFIALFAIPIFAQAQAPAVIQQPSPTATVISPLTNTTAQSGQALLNQINATITQRRFEHQVLTLQPAPAPVIVTTPILIRAR